MELHDFLHKCWSGYSQITPDSGRIYELLSGRGERIVNDHVAFRTFNIPGIDRLSLGRFFEQWGYQRKEDMTFTEKKLLAAYWLHPDPALPKIFISELLLEKFEAPLQNWIRGLVGSLRPITEKTFLEPCWDPPRYEDYERFYPQSEYAAWTAAFGIRVNHFTVFFNSLKSFASLSELNDFLIANGFKMNTSGGLIKGTPAERLEQSSTLAQTIPWTFAGGNKQPVMSCYYEFALRYPLPSGELFQGFIPKSADKIFESTFKS
ncbi:MAG TPA: DUF1338 domain-containing protein [Bdellovibrionota bacterium]|jgi:hypothetical protein